MCGAPTARTSGAEHHAEEAAEALSEVVGQERVEDRVYTAVHIGETAAGDLSGNEGEIVVSVVPDELDDEDQLEGQPAEREDDDDDDDEPRHASLAAHALSRGLATSGSGAVEKTLHHETVKDADHGEWNDVGEREEARVVDSPVVVGSRRVVVIVDESVEAGGSFLPVEVVHNSAMLDEHGNVDAEDEHPGGRCNDRSVPPRSPRHRPDGVNNSKVPVKGHHDEGVDAGVGRDVYDVLVDLAPAVTERPDGYGVTDCGERNADDDEEEVGCGEVDDEDVGGVAHLAIRGDDDDDEEVPGQSDEGDNREDGGYDSPNDGLEAIGGGQIVVVVVVVRLAASGHVDDEFRRCRISGLECRH